MSRMSGMMLPANPTRADREDWMLSPMSSGMQMWHPMHQFSQFGEIKINSTIAEVSLEGEGIGSSTLSAGYFYHPGKMVKSEMMGYWAKTDSSNLTLRIRLETALDVPVTLQVAGDTITLVGHGITAITAHNMSCVFHTLSGTTGISINIIYFVKYLSADTFQISATRTFTRLTPSTGATINLTGADGTGTVVFSTIIHAKLFEQTNRFRDGGGHFLIESMTTAMTIGKQGTVNMHGNFSLFEGDSAEMIGLHTENLILAIDTTIPLKIVCSAQWSASSAINHITSTNYVIM